MSKPENFGVIVFLGLLVMCLCTLLFWMLLKFAVQEGQVEKNRRELNKAALVLREEREKLERLLKTVENTEKGKE
jgi:predicted Holliday junction resolvase-like endonuclease